MSVYVYVVIWYEASADGGGYFKLMGAFTTRRGAEDEIDRLVESGYEGGLRSAFSIDELSLQGMIMVEAVHERPA